MNHFPHLSHIPEQAIALDFNHIPKSILFSHTLHSQLIFVVALLLVTPQITWKKLKKTYGDFPEKSNTENIIQTIFRSKNWPLFSRKKNKIVFNWKHYPTKTILRRNKWSLNWNRMKNLETKFDFPKKNKN